MLPLVLRLPLAVAAVIAAAVVAAIVVAAVVVVLVVDIHLHGSSGLCLPSLLLVLPTVAAGIVVQQRAAGSAAPSASRNCRRLCDGIRCRVARLRRRDAGQVRRHTGLVLRHRRWRWRQQRLLDHAHGSQGRPRRRGLGG